MADQVCECTHFGDDHHPDAEDSRCKVIGCDCTEFREQPGPTRTMGITMSVETAIGLEIEAALALNVHAAAALGQRIYERVVQPVIANLEAEVERQRARAEREHAMWHDVNEAQAALASPPPGPRVWKKGDPEPTDAGLRLADPDGNLWFRDHPGATFWWTGAWPMLTWAVLTSKYGPLVEVLEDGPDVAVLRAKLQRDPEVIQDGSYPDGGADG